MSHQDELLEEVIRRTHDAVLGYANIAKCTHSAEIRSFALGEVELRTKFAKQLSRGLQKSRRLKLEQGTPFGWLLRRWKDCCAFFRSESGMLKAAHAGIDTTLQSYEAMLTSNPQSASLRDTLHGHVSHLYDLKARLRSAIMSTQPR